MNTARLKNIVIIILLLANAFLLVLLFSLHAEENAANRRTVEQLCELFASDGVALDASMLERFSAAPYRAAQPVRDISAEQTLAEGVIGAVSSVDSGGGIYRYYSAAGMSGGVCLIRGSGALEATLSRETDDPSEFCRALCAPYGYELFETQTDGVVTTVTANRMLDGLEVYNCPLTFSFSGSVLVSVSGFFLPLIETEEDGGTALDAATALVRFLDYRNASGTVCTEITGLAGGYLLQSSAGAPQQLAPVLRVETDVYSYYVNAETGEVTRG